MDPLPRLPLPHGGSGGGSGREDCWSEGATEALVEAWGERYVQLKRGNLRQKDWQEVADAVNEHQHALGRPRRTDVQCKNRIDTLKKKYKVEKARRGPSQWAFFSRLDELVGPVSGSGSALAGAKKHHNHHQVPAPAALKSEPYQTPNRPSLTFKLKNRTNPGTSPGLFSGGSSSRSRMNSSPGSSESSRGDTAGGADDDLGDDDEEDDEDRGMFRLAEVPAGLKRRWGGLMDEGRYGGGGGGSGTEEAFGELARAIAKFGEIYERVESSKQQQMMELERQRMEFTKDLEFQRMQMFMEAQLELEKMKRPKYSPHAGKKS